MKFKPLQDRIVVKRLKEESKTAGGIFIPDVTKEKPQKGEIIAVGTGKRAKNGVLIQMESKVGDNILFGKYAGTEIKIEDVECLIMQEDDILGIME